MNQASEQGKRIWRVTISRSVPDSIAPHKVKYLSADSVESLRALLADILLPTKAGAATNITISVISERRKEPVPDQRKPCCSPDKHASC